VKLLGLAGSFVFCAWTGSAQTGGAGDKAEADPIIRVNVDLRQVDLIVTDSKGNHVSDLQPTDFELLEDGKLQRISNFSWVEVTPPASGERLAALREKPSLLERYTGAVRLRKTPGNDILSAPVTNLRQEEIRRVIAIVAGDGSAPVATRIRKFIDEQLGPGDMASVRSTRRSIIPIKNSDMVQVRDSMGIFQQFTNDKRQLDAATERLQRVCLLHMCFTDEAEAWASAIRSLQNLPGRKAIVFVGRYKGPTDNVIRLANQAGVVIYVVDPVGVESGAQFVDEAVAPESERVLAEKTGGRRILSTAGFDLTTAFDEVIEDLSGYYLLGYHPAAGDSERKSPIRHKIDVRVLRAGMKVRVRDGLMGSPDPGGKTDSDAAPAQASQPKGREEILKNALFSIFTQDDLRIRLNPLVTASSPNQKKKRSPLVRVSLDIDGRDLTFTSIDAGKKKAVVDVAVAVFNEEGSQVGAANQAFTFQASNEKAAEMGKSSLQYHLEVTLSTPGPHQVRAAVRDATSGEVGSAYAFIDIPDFNQSKTSLSSLVLRLPQSAPRAAGARLEWNEFAPGANVEYLCEVLGLKTQGNPPMPPNVETEVKLYRGGGPAASIPRSATKIERVEDRWVLAGNMRIPGDLPAGNYTMELLVYDGTESSKKKQAAEQWIDLTVVGTPTADTENRR
jgi:VWFA-related protein